jgi:hypothetical protein
METSPHDPQPPTPDLPDPLPPNDPQPVPEPDPSPLPGPVETPGVDSPLIDLRPAMPGASLRLVPGGRRPVPRSRRGRERRIAGGDHLPAA